MTTWGKLAGASAGYFVGGIIGAVVGAVAGGCPGVALFEQIAAHGWGVYSQLVDVVDAETVGVHHQHTVPVCRYFNAVACTVQYACPAA